MTMRRAQKIALASVGGIIALVLIVVLLLTHTNWGRHHVLAFGLDQLASSVHGYVKVSDIHGNLLTGARLDNASITDSAGRPFLHADTLALRYSLRSLLQKHLVLSNVRLVRATVILDQPPGEEWNFSRLFPTGPTLPNQQTGFGSWVLI